MAIIGSYSIGGSPTSLSYEYSTLDELLLGLLDNTSGSIKAIDVRGPVYTIWERIEGLSASLSVSGTAATSYISSTPSSNQTAVGGVLTGSTFSGTIQNVLDSIFYPYVSPFPSISTIGTGFREFGAPLSVSLNYSVTLGTEPITPTTLVVAGTPKIFPPYSGVHITTSTHSSVPLTASQSSSFVISVNDGTNTVTGTQTFYWINRRYWGRINLISIGNPNLTESPISVALVTSLCTDVAILALNGANANGQLYGSELSATKAKYYEGIDAQGNYLVFAWPSTVSGAITPVFRVNGTINTAFTNVRTGSPMVNTYGFSGTDYEVWVSNTRYFSPVDIEIS